MKERFMQKCISVVVFIKNAWITIWLITIAVLLSITSVYAAYTGVTTSKRVISLSDRDNMLFSSRYLFVTSSSVQRVGFSSNEEDPTITIDVNNYDKNGLGKYGKDIHFTLSVRLINTDGTTITSTVTSGAYSIAHLENNNDESPTRKLSSLSNTLQPIPYNGSSNIYTLEGGKKSQEKFVLHFDPDDLITTGYAVEIIANPVDTYDDIKTISGRVAATSRTSQSNEWSGSFTDSFISGTSVSDFDAYNYVISGVGTGTIKLTYNNVLLELDENDEAVFAATEGFSKDETTTSGKTVITFAVDTSAEDAVSRYAIHFYQKSGTALSSFSTNYVLTEFTAS